MSIKKKHILIIDDDREITELIDDYLTKNGFRTTCAYNGLTINTLLRDNNFDLIILDTMLPGITGLSVCKIIREAHNTPIIMLSAADSTADRVAGLELGADDYVPKPFSSRELLARINAQLRRSQGELKHKHLAFLNKIQFGQWILDRETHSLIGLDAVAMPLSRREYELLLVFIEHPGRILSRDQLMDMIYDKSFDAQDRTIDVLIGRVRKKIEDDPKNPQILLTVRGGGYQLQTKITTL
ncbi:MAG: response regulator transcription factor [Legionella sp.]|nr:response regulator transcription factor [Legionella sp.]